MSGCGGSDLHGVASFDIDSIALGAAPCSAIGPPTTWHLRNDAADGGRLHFAARVEGPFILSGLAEGSLEPAERGTVLLEAKLPTTTRRFATVTGTLIVSTSDPSHPEIRIPLSAVATGAELHFGDAIDLGEVPVAGQLDLPLRIENKGDDSVVVDFGAPDVPTFQTKVPSIQVAAHSSNLDASFHFQALSVGQVETVVPVSYRGSICGDPPSSLKLRARGVTGIAVNPGKLDFGLTDCGATADFQTFKVENTTNKLVTLKLTHQNPAASIVYVANSSEEVGTTTIAPLSTLVLEVRPAPVPTSASTAPNAIGDLLTLTTDVPGDYPHTVVVSHTAYGAVLALPAKTSAGRRIVDANPSATISVPLTNSGNAAVQVSGATSGGTATFPNAPVGAGGTVSVTTTLTPDPAHLGFADARTMSYSVTGPVCGVDQAQIEMTPFDLAVDIDYPREKGGCIVGRTGRIYWTTGQSQSLGLIPPPPTDQSVTYIPGLAGTRVFIEAYLSVWAQNGSTLTNSEGYYPTLTLPSGFGKVFHPTSGGNPRFCVNDGAGQFRCIGGNILHEFGNGASGSQWTTWEASMSGVTGITDFAAIDVGSLVLSGGQVYGAGTNFADVFRTGVLYGDYPTPVLVPGISNVSRIAASIWEGCAIHDGGQVSCWSDAGVKPVVGILDAVELATFGGVCVIRQNGSVRCSDRQPIPNIWDPPNLVTPVRKITPYATIEANGAVTSWYKTYPQTFHVLGFEGP